jgi:hypothetical protein
MNLFILANGQIKKEMAELQYFIKIKVFTKVKND